MSKHTPGPWTFDADHDRVLFGGTYAPNTNKSDWPNGTHISDLSPDDADRDEAIANARLIAAAPDLLEALKGLVDFRGHTQGFDWINDRKTSEAFEKARQVIAKAEGK